MILKNIKYYGILLMVSMTISVSCNKDHIDVAPFNVTEADYFKTEIQFTKAVFGIYAKQSDWYWYSGGGSLIPVTYLPGDDVTTTGQEAFEQFGQIQPSDGSVSYYYSVGYQLIGRANIVLQKLEEEEGVYQTAGLKDIHRGEALFLRGLAYYNLWNVYGTSPLITKRIEDPNELRNPGTTGTQLLDQAISDFTEAAGLLPASWDAANRGRATANSANGMLGKSLVFRGTVNDAAADFTAAIQAFDKLTGVSLVPKFDDNFAADAENNAESLYEFQSSSPYGQDNVWLDNDFNDAVGSMSTFWGFYNNSWALFGRAPFIATQKLIDAFDAGDPRRDLTLDPGSKAIKKYVTRDYLTNSGVASANNPRILRYADVFLLKAEAILKSGGSTSDAISLINEVRTRARNMVGGGTFPENYSTAETNTTTIMNWIIKERLLELAAEGQRWFDIKRWHIAGDLVLNNAFFSATNPAAMSFEAPKHLYFPIPTSELDVNPNVTQNPGY
jgi:tetratricopeptide (TPR) repeat protein